MKNNYKLIALFVLLAAFGCKENTKATVAEEHHEENENVVELSNEQLAQTEIKIGKVEKRQIGNEISVNGMIDVPPQGNISITVPYGGFLKYNELLPGSKVKKGQLIAKIENPEYIEFQKLYLEALANNEYLKADFERQEILSKEEVTSAKVFQQAKSRYLTNSAQIKALESKLRLIGVNPSNLVTGTITSVVNTYAPITGIVKDIYVNTGKYFGPQDVLMDITDASDLHVELTIFEDDMPLIREGQRIRFRLTNAPEKWMEAKIFLIGNNVREDRSVTVHGHLEEINENLMPGMFVNAKVEVGTKEQYTVPETGVVHYQNKYYVFKSNGKKTEGEAIVNDFEMIEVVIGNTEDGYTAISLVKDPENIEAINLVTNDAFTLLSKAKNSEGGGHGH
tara:strand:+ start:314737 stop:315921 length:1185 start_codon:yes stop_codon:yes gene_type:complete